MSFKRYNEAIAILMNGPITMLELRRAMNVNSNNQVERYIRALRDQGLVYIAGHTPTRAACMAWQPKPFAIPDAKPPAVCGRRMRGVKRPLPTVSSVFALGDMAAKEAA